MWDVFYHMLVANAFGFNSVQKSLIVGIATDLQFRMLALVLLMKHAFCIYVFRKSSLELNKSKDTAI